MNTPSNPSTQSALESRARRAARARGWFARKSRTPVGIGNHGSFRLVDASTNSIVHGEKFDLTAQDVLGLCGAGQ